MTGFWGYILNIFFLWKNLHFPIFRFIFEMDFKPILGVIFQGYVIKEIICYIIKEFILNSYSIYNIYI